MVGTHWKRSSWAFRSLLATWRRIGHRALSLALKTRMTSVCVTFCVVTCGSPLSTSVPDSRELATKIWTILKTLLFMTVMLSQSVLSTITYTRPSAAPPDPERFATHSSLALSTLRTLSHLSFVITKFGGVTSTSGVGFAELKRVFYSALDVLSADVEASEAFVKSLDTHGLSITGCLLSQLFHSSPCTKFRQVPAQGDTRRILSYAPGKHSTLRASNSSSPYFPSKRSKTLPFLCAFRMLAS